MANGFDAASFTNTNSTDTVNLLSTGDFALKSLDWSYEYDGAEFPKQSDSGQNPAQSFVRRLVVVATVQILGTSASDYWTNRATLVKAFLVDDGAQTAYPHGRLSVTPGGGGASMYADCNVTGISLPVAYDEQAALVSTATVNLRADRGYWLLTSGGTVVRL